MLNPLEDKEKRVASSVINQLSQEAVSFILSLRQSVHFLS